MLLSGLRQQYGKLKIGFFLGVNWRKVIEEIDYSATWLYKLAKRFSFRGGRYSYRMDRYNRTFDNERTVEVPIFLVVLGRFRGKRVLEVGNVLGHYGKFTHTVVDKYEKAPGVINEDIVDFEDEPFDLIVSISTLEHVGFDEKGEKANKGRRALKQLKKLVKPGGELWISVPLGYNRVINELMLVEEAFDEVRFMRRMSQSNLWQEIEKKAAKRSSYNEPYPYGNTIAVGIWHNSGNGTA
jgi:SAM-dependent methyltransferase